METTTKTINTVVYGRVSTLEQDYERQVNELTEYSKQMNYNICGVFTEKISGYKKTSEREQLLNLIEYVTTNNVDKVLVWELSRLGRNVLEVLNVIKELNKHKVSLYIKQYNIETLNDDKTENGLTMFMVQLLTGVSEIERKWTMDRVRSGYRNYRKNGGKVGRKEGQTESKDYMLQKHCDIVKYLDKGHTILDICKLTNKSDKTVQRVKKLVYTVN